MEAYEPGTCEGRKEINKKHRGSSQILRKVVLLGEMIESTQSMQNNRINLQTM